MATGRKKTKKQRDKSAKAELKDVGGGVLSNMSPAMIKKLTGMTPSELGKHQTSGMGKEIRMKDLLNTGIDVATGNLVPDLTDPELGDPNLGGLRRAAKYAGQ